MGGGYNRRRLGGNQVLGMLDMKDFCSLTLGMGEFMAYIMHYIHHMVFWNDSIGVLI